MKHPHVIGLVVAITTLLAAALPAASAAGEGAAQRAAATLELNAALGLTSRIGACPTPAGADDCAVRTLTGLFPGLGTVRASYGFLVTTTPPRCADPNLGKALSYPIRLEVAEKGALLLEVAEGPCVDHDAIRTQTQSFTVSGGTGIYAGATGSGSLARTLGEDSGNGRAGKETWTGTISVPGLEFDLARPTLTGATNRTVAAKKGAKSARVVFKVTASDDKDGARPVACTARSGAKFNLGRTRVSCSATDTSGNEAAVVFTVTVRRAR